MSITAWCVVAIVVAYLVTLAVLTGWRAKPRPECCPECGRMGRVQADDEEATVRHCPWCTSVWIERKDHQ